MMETKISATVVADSVNVMLGNRLTTLEVVMPRCILAEFNTHRVMSRNTSSSRAIPVAKVIDMVRTDPFRPHVWTKNEPGMQGYQLLEGKMLELAQREWEWARKLALEAAENMNSFGAHKQIINRLLEPFMWCKVLVSATEWEGFFAQRCHSAAEPHMQLTADAIRAAVQESTPKYLAPGEWHIPYDPGGSISTRICVASARCAHTSYTVFDGPKIEGPRAFQIYEKLVGSDPMHASPLEHCAVALATQRRNLSRNFNGFGQHRAFVEMQIEPELYDTAGFLEMVAE